jgi:hypothetical protein
VYDTDAAGEVTDARSPAGSYVKLVVAEATVDETREPFESYLYVVAGPDVGVDEVSC